MKSHARLTIAARRVMRYALVIASVLLLSTSFYFEYRARSAEAFLDGIDLRARATSGATFYASRKRIFVGQKLSRNEVVAHLAVIRYQEAVEGPGTYWPSGDDTLAIRPRFPEFQPLVLHFGRGTLVRIEARDPEGSRAADVREAALEPESLGAFIVSVDNEEATRMFVRRYPVQFSDIRDSHVLPVLLVSEDASFFSHGGTRFDGILKSLVMPGRTGGGSSITAQTVKNAVSLDRTHSVTRKLDELFLSAALERRMTKEEILTLYCNSTFLGGGGGSPNVYGFLAAAETYFGRTSLGELTLAEASTLVAMLPEPNSFLREARSGNYVRLDRRRGRVLDLLHATFPDRYPSEVIEPARREHVSLTERRYAEQPIDVLCKPFVSFAAKRQPLVDLEGLPPHKYSGIRVYTSVDPDLMREAQRILAERIPAIERRFPPAEAGACGGDKDRLLGAVVAMDPVTGEVVVMTGGGGGEDGVNYANLAINALAEPASTIKPFWVALALDEARLPDGSRYTAASIVDPSDNTLAGWRPRHGVEGAGRVRARLASSADDFALYTLKLAGLERGKLFYESATGATISGSTGQLGIGFGPGTEVSPLRLASAYTVLATNGVRTEPNPVSRVYVDGVEVAPVRPGGTRLISDGAAYITTQMLRSTLGFGPDGVRGTAREAFRRSGLRHSSVEMGAKTGSGPHSVWMVSVSPRLVVTVLLTYQCHSNIRNASEMFASDTAAVLWADFMASVARLRPDLLEGSFPRPASVLEMPIDLRTGCLSARSGDFREYFIAGTQPGPCP